MSEKDQKRGRVTEENRRESEALKRIWARTKEARAARGIGTQEAFGARFNIGGQAVVGFFLNGKTALSLKAGIGFAEGLEVTIGEFSPRLAAQRERLAQGGDEHFALVKRADVSVSAGRGALVFYEGEMSDLSFRRDFLRSQGVSEANAVVVDVKGPSMEPTIADGAVLLLNRAVRDVVQGRIYAFRLHGELFVKRLHRRGEELVAVSDNPDRQAFPDIPIVRNASFEIIGRAVWMGTRL